MPFHDKVNLFSDIQVRATVGHYPGGQSNLRRRVSRWRMVMNAVPMTYAHHMGHILLP